MIVTMPSVEAQFMSRLALVGAYMESYDNRTCEINYHKASAGLVKNTLVHRLNKPRRGGVNIPKLLAGHRPSYDEWSPEQRRAFISICCNAIRELGHEIPGVP